jgi:alpha-beta hydrolase superfamily lysophospholipase
MSSIGSASGAAHIVRCALEDGKYRASAVLSSPAVELASIATVWEIVRKGMGVDTMRH